MLQMTRRLWSNLWQKFQIWTVLGLYSHISAPIGVKFGMGSGQPNFTLIGAMCPPLGWKPIFGLLSKCNTGMAALLAELPVITWKWYKIRL